MDPSDLKMLAEAVARLEQQSFAISIANVVGMPIEALMRRMPPGTQSAVASAVNKALEQCLRVALKASHPDSSTTLHNRRHKLMTATTGAAGGFFGLPGLAIELPVTTTLMLHSIAEIARSYGEDLKDPESALACLEVLAFGTDSTKADAVESAYYATRAALAHATREAATYLAEKGLTKTGAPALLQFLSKIAARFGIEVTEKVAAQLVPIAGAVGGLTVNVMFTSHFQRLAQGHFAIRRLERIYGHEIVHQEYEKLRLAQSASNG
jgi:EcsC protein family